MRLLSILIVLLASTASLGQAKPQILLNKLNTVTLRGEINLETVTKAQFDLVEKIKERGTLTYPIYLVLDSPGGSIMAGEAFIEFARTLPNIETVTLFAASMASAIVEALPGKRHIVGSGIMMFHRAAGRFQGQFEVGEVESQLAFWKSYVRNMEQRNADRLGISLEAYKDKVVHEYWLTSEQSIKDKAADQIVTVTCSAELISEVIKTTVSSIFGEFEITTSACPLIRGEI